jgi:putative chitinase
MQITADVLKNATGASDSLVSLYLPYFNAVLDQYNINTQGRVLAFLSQVGLESGSLRYTEELASGSAYEGRADLGNTQPGDGVRFKGRSLIQITGRANYQNISDALGVDFVSNPELLATPQYATAAAAWWWNNAGLNELADQMDPTLPLTDPTNDAIYKQITKKINGGYNGLAQRQANWMNGQGAVLALQQAVADVSEFAQANPKTAIALGVTAFLLLAGTITYFVVYKDRIKQDFIAA